MRTRVIQTLAAVLVCAALLSGVAKASDKYRRQTLVNNSDSNANDLHVKFDYNVWDAKVRPKDQPPGHDGHGAGSGEGGMCGRTWDFAPPNTFGTVGPGGVVYLDYMHSCPLGEVHVDPSLSYFTLDGNALPGFTRQGWPMSITEDVYDRPTEVRIQNNTGVPRTYENFQAWTGNSLLHWNIDSFFLPTGVPEAALPTTFALNPGQEMVLPLSLGPDYTYVVAMVDSYPTGGDPIIETAQDYLAVRSGPPECLLTYNCVTGMLTMDTGANVINGFIIHSRNDGFTGLADLPPGFLFNTNSEDTISSQLGITLAGVHLFGAFAFEKKTVLWNELEGRWDTELLSFTYTVDGVESVFYGDIELTGELPGDTNLDGLVDAWDIQRILAANSYANGSGWSWEQGDYTGDGLVTMEDIQMILDHGQYDAGVAGMLAAMVPEPTTLAILLFGAAGLLGRRERMLR